MVPHILEENGQHNQQRGSTESRTQPGEQLETSCALIIPGSGERMNNFYAEFSSCCAAFESGIKIAEYAGALDSAFGAWLVDRLGGV
jgi:hypothetical protein